MRYTPPPGSTDPNAPYVTGVPGVMRGSPVPAEAVENPQREIVNVITEAGLTPSNEDLTQLAQAITAQILASGGALRLNSEAWITASGEWEAPARGWYWFMAVDGGCGAVYQSNVCCLLAGHSGAVREGFVFLEKGQRVNIVIGAGALGSQGIWATMNYGGATTFGDFEGALVQDIIRGMRTPAYNSGALPANTSYVYAEASCPGGGGAAQYVSGDTQTDANARCNGRYWGAGGGASLMGDKTHYAVGAGYQGVVRVRWHDPEKAAGPLPTPALFSARRMARTAAEPQVVNLYDPATGQGSVWREEDVEAKLAQGLITQEAWQEICAAKAAENHAAWLASPDTEAERFALLRAARDARIAATDYLVAPDYPLTDAQRAEVTAYRQALRDLPAQAGAPWDGGGEGTPWPTLPAFLQPEDA